LACSPSVEINRHDARRIRIHIHDNPQDTVPEFRNPRKAVFQVFIHMVGSIHSGAEIALSSHSSVIRRFSKASRACSVRE